MAKFATLIANGVGNKLSLIILLKMLNCAKIVIFVFWVFIAFIVALTSKMF